MTIMSNDGAAVQQPQLGHDAQNRSSVVVPKPVQHGYDDLWAAAGELSPTSVTTAFFVPPSNQYNEIPATVPFDGDEVEAYTTRQSKKKEKRHKEEKVESKHLLPPGGDKNHKPRKPKTVHQDKDNQEKPDMDWVSYAASNRSRGRDTNTEEKESRSKWSLSPPKASPTQMTALMELTMTLEQSKAKRSRNAVSLSPRKLSSRAASTDEQWLDIKAWLSDLEKERQACNISQKEKEPSPKKARQKERKQDPMTTRHSSVHGKDKSRHERGWDKKESPRHAGRRGVVVVDPLRIKGLELLSPKTKNMPVGGGAVAENDTLVQPVTTTDKKCTDPKREEARLKRKEYYKAKLARTNK